MAKSATTWKAGQNPVKKKGQRHRRTLLKESIGLKNWAKLESFIKNEGAQRLVLAMTKLPDKDFIVAYHALAEYVVPKLQRVDAKLTGDLNLLAEATVTYK